MYPSQQVAYSLNNKKYRHHRHFQYHAAAKTDNNNLFFIGNQQLVYSFLPSMHQQNYRLQHDLSSTLHLSSSSSLSLSRIRFGSHLLPTTGHTLHWIDNALVSFFGKPNQPSMTIIETRHSSSYILSPYLALSSPSPSGRYAHTTTYIRNKNNTTQLYLIGGSTIENDEPLADIWRLDWESKTWINLTTPLGPFEPGLMGHVTLALPQQSSIHLLTCFGAHHYQHTFAQHCTLFNTNSLVWKKLRPSSSSSSSSSVPIPAPRIYTSMVPANGTHAVLYGGISSTSTLLDDLWWVDLSNIDSTNGTIMFTPLAHSVPRAGHVALMVSDSLMLVDGGQYDGSLENRMAILDLASLDSSATRYGHRKRGLESGLPAEGMAHDSIQSSSSSSSQGSSGISGGAIGGIIVAVVLALGVTITFIVFYQRRQRRQRNYDLHSRAVRFSLSTPPRPSESYIEQQQQQRSSIIQHPEAAKTRLSHMSFGSEFYMGLDIDGARSSASSLPARSKTSSSSITPKSSSTNNNHPNMLDSPSRQLYTNWVCETPVPPSAIAATTSEYNLSGALDPRHTSMYINQSALQNSADNGHDENDDDDDEGGAKKRSSTAFKRLRLSIFKPLDIGSSITEQPGNASQQQQQDQHHPSQTKNGLGGPSSCSAAVHEATGSDHQPTASATKRRSSMFGLSRFLNIGDSTTGGEHEQNQSQDDGPDQQKQQHQVYPPYHRHHYQTDARASLGSKSVASIQWVEFNNDMDFDSGLTSRHLAVMNNRQSVATISSSSGFGSASVDDISLGSKPTSPRNTLIMAQQQQQLSFYQRPHHPSSSSSSYRLGHRELQSWDDARMSKLGSSPPPPHHHHLLATRDPTKTNSFPTLTPLNVD